MKPQLWVTDIWEESDRPLLPEHTFTPSRNQTIDSLDNLCRERKKEIGLMVIPRVSKFLVTGPSLSISESRENLFSGLQMLHTLLAGICSSTSSHFVKLAGTWSSTSPHFVKPTGTWNSTSPHFVKLAGTSVLVPGSSSLQCPSIISLFVGLKCPTPLGVHTVTRLWAGDFFSKATEAWRHLFHRFHGTQIMQSWQLIDMAVRVNKNYINLL